MQQMVSTNFTFPRISNGFQDDQTIRRKYESEVDN